MARVVLVTGGASGLGLATVERFLNRGYRVVSADKASAGRRDDRATVVECDVTREDHVANALDAADALGGASIVVNCAGIGLAQRTLSSKNSSPHSLDDFSRVLSVNAAGTFNVVRLAAERMARRQPDEDDGERGVFVNTASIAAYDGQIGQVAYAASKGAIVSMTLPLARDLAVHSIRVNTIAPGLFETPLLTVLPDAVRQTLVSSVPFPHRLGAPSEFARLVEAIVDNRMLNGEVIRLDAALRMPPKSQ